MFATVASDLEIPSESMYKLVATKPNLVVQRPWPRPLPAHLGTHLALDFGTKLIVTWLALAPLTHCPCTQ